MNKELFRKHFNFQMPSTMLKALHNTKDKNRNNPLVNLIKGKLNDLKDEIEEMSENKIEIEESYKTADIVEKILKLNRQE